MTAAPATKSASPMTWNDAAAHREDVLREISRAEEAGQLQVFKDGAKFLGGLALAGWLAVNDTGDDLYHAADDAGLVARFGNDAVQEILSSAFNIFTDTDQPPEPPPVESLAEYGSAAPTPGAQSNQPARFKPVAIDDVEATAGPAWLVQHLLPTRGLACIVGPPKSGKSFMTTDMLFSVARGVPYAGRATLPGPVIYLTGEGVMGFKRRLIAMRRHYDVEGHGVPFFMIENVPDLGSERTDVHDLLRELDQFITERRLARPRALALDTLARCMGEGDENTARDMGRFVNRCGVIERHFECAVAVVHHMGKNPAAGGRGSNALNGAADVTITVEKSDAFSTVRIDEMKDGPEGQEWRFRLVPYDLAETSDTPTETTNETTTCVVELMGEATRAKPRETKTNRAPKGVVGDLLLVIRHALNEAGEASVPSVDVPNNVRAVSRANLRNYCKTKDWQDPDGKPDAFRAMLNKTLSTLRSGGHIGFNREWVWLI